MTETPENPPQPTPPPAPESSGAAVPGAGSHAFQPVTSSDQVVPAHPEQARPEAASASDPAQPEVAQAYAVPPYAAPAQPYQSGQPYPGAAHPAASYDPNAPAYDPNAPEGVPPYGGYPGAAPAPKKSLSKGALFGIIGGAAAVVLIIAAAIIVPAVLRGPAITASDVVESYLTALADGDAEAALEYVDPYGEDTLLTDDVLAASLELGAIDDIEVAEVEESDDYETRVPVTFTIGGQEVSRDFQVYNYGTDDEWQIADGLISLAGFYGFEGLGLTVNGSEAPETAYVFPGTYELAVGVEQFMIEGDTTTFVVASDADAEVLWDLRPVLTEDGTAQFRSLVRASVEECIAMKTLTTPCGLDLTDIDLNGATPIDGTVTRTITAEGQSTLDSLTAEVESGAIVTTYDSVDVEMTLEGDQGGTRAEFEVWFGGYLNSPKVDFAAEAPAVVWE
ncbi:hypothetical protein [Microbacterium sp. NPDC056234]|uniref:hypothetical protein n=1 Tax=Microbacterium sp. NPDC056234 TaxID=3345757 RepID=UPI0035DA694F